MTADEKVKKIGAILDELYPKVSPSLNHTDAYTLLIAVVLSAQCTDARVNEVTEKLFARAACPEEMLSLGIDGIREYIRSLGLAQSKANYLHGLSKIIVDSYHGKVPCDLVALERLPGVGHKTAAVVMAQAFGVPTFPVDTHIFRLSKRWGITQGKTVRACEEDLKRLFPQDEWIKRHIQFISFGRDYCKATGHDQSQCPICSWASNDNTVNPE